MCLAVPSKIIEIKSRNQPGDIAIVETLGVAREAVIALLDEKAEIGDYVLLHAGFAIRKINLQEAQKSLQLHEEIMRTSSDNTNNKADDKKARTE